MCNALKRYKQRGIAPWRRQIASFVHSFDCVCVCMRESECVCVCVRVRACV